MSKPGINTEIAHKQHRNQGNTVNTDGEPERKALRPLVSDNI